MKLRLAFVFSLVLSACGTDDIDLCIERSTITQGLYGQLIYGCDTADCHSSYGVGQPLRVYTEDPTGGVDHGTDAGTDLTPIAMTSAADDGTYEVELAAGRYFVCTQNCTAVTLSDAAPRKRLDWYSGPGGGNWSESTCTP